MALIKKSKLNEMTLTDLQTELQKAQSEYRAENAAKGTSGKAINPGRFKQLRRLMARLITKANEKKFAKSI